VHCRKRLVPPTPVQRLVGALMAVMVLTTLVALGGVLFASCATGVVIALVLGPVLAVIASLFARRR